MSDVAIVALLFGAPALLVGLAAGFFLGRSGRALAILGLVGAALIVGYVLIGIARTDPATCHDCSEGLGGAYSVLDVIFAFFNAIGWVVGVLVGGWFRRRRSDGRGAPMHA